MMPSQRAAVNSYTGKVVAATCAAGVREQAGNMATTNSSAKRKDSFFIVRHLFAYFCTLLYHICQEKRACRSKLFWVCSGLVVLHPVVDLGLSQTQNIFSGVGRVFAAADLQEVQASGSLIQGLFIASGIAVEATDVLLDQGSGFGVVLLLADDLLHVGQPPFGKLCFRYGLLYIFFLILQWLF